VQEYIAEENLSRKKKVQRKTLVWQSIIFLLAFSINQLISFRDHIVMDVSKETPDSIATVTVSLFKGIGYIILGNLYDNVGVPKNLTFYLLIILAILTALCALVPPDIARDPAKRGDEEWDQLVTQIASVRLFESGIQIACLIILFNWFPLNFSGLAVAIWNAGYYLIPIIMKMSNIKPSDNYVRCILLTPGIDNRLPDNGRTLHHNVIFVQILLPPSPLAHRRQDKGSHQIIELLPGSKRQYTSHDE
jgi:hypothetical protein